MASRSGQPSWKRTALLGLVSLGCLLQPAAAVKESDFKKCDHSGFCNRNRKYADNAISQGSSFISPYEIIPESASFRDGQLEAVILKTINDQEETVRLPITVSFLESGTARVTVDEERRQKKDIELRHNSRARKERYNEVEKLAIVGGLTLDSNARLAHQDKSHITVKYGPSSSFEAVIKLSPFGIEFKRDGATHVKLNDRGLLNVEHWRPKVEPAAPVHPPPDGDDQQQPLDAEPPPVETREDETSWWDEFFGGNTDTKPRGPESVALDISFVGYEHVYGIPEHASSLSLKETRGGEGQYTDPYRLYNADVFEYVLDSPMTLYGSIPFMQAHKKNSSVGVFWLNAAETWVDITKAKASSNPLAIGSKTTTNTHWMSESGLLDVFVFLGPTPHEITKDYSQLTGTTTMPQEFAIGYHQCRWNYISDDDVKDVDRRMDRYQIPYDVIWLDLEYTDDRKFFTWDAHMFKDPIAMGEKLQESKRQLVVLIDPHIKNKEGYSVFTELKANELAVRNKDDNMYDGWCWPGSSHWVDCFNPKAIEWWATLFKYDKFQGTLENTFIWNDMNEPSVFNGPEVTMPKDNLHFGGWEHRDVHNVNGMTFHNATFQALLSRKANELRRPFVLTRSFYAGSQRFGAMWTGDNQADWGHLAASLPMILNQGIAGFPFGGSDVGGFFGNPEAELLTRWYQAGAFFPFFRAHAHIDARRREPYLLSEPYRGIVTAAVRLRYSLLPAWYTAFFHAHRDGSPIVRPMFWTHPSEEAGFAVDDQLFLGSTGLLHKPVVEKDTESVDMFIPDDEVYYDYFTYRLLPTAKGKRVTVAAPLDRTGLLMRGGHIVPRRDTPRRSAQLMRFDDYTLVVAVNKAGTAEGELYVDDGDSYDYEGGQFIHRAFRLDTANGGSITSVDAQGRDTKAIQPGAWLKAMDAVHVDKVIVVGAPAAAWKNKAEVTVQSGAETWTAPVKYYAAEQGRAAFAVIGRVGARIGEDWTVKLA
ncbi:neutral alpha-glucosidase AB [Sodiomyces alkalinus F11]|uniref:alpha-glucosidase n=1 Tax=Sodiomyces alkalinus (strain CBS 110278 / VKM F-3762 / F11) TaxID=1314773 RepID=A0A3N2PWV7_SODAK|nr:neutral alpha-glucosidase AB [Sodiomyces alkalinus F11]ROT39009.1 neutral alpha-glucosidase AB [Sodiomyces alkalinus F11]